MLRPTTDSFTAAAVTEFFLEVFLGGATLSLAAAAMRMDTPDTGVVGMTDLVLSISIT